MSAAIQHRSVHKRGVIQPLTQYLFCHWSYQSFRSRLGLPASVSDTEVLRLCLRYINARRGWLKPAVAFQIQQGNSFSTPRDGVPAGSGGFDITDLRDFFTIPAAWHDDIAINLLLHVFAKVFPALADDALPLVAAWHLNSRAPGQAQ